jgi:hypothetical protein
MALRNLNVRTLVSILDGWTHPSRARPVLEKLPLLAALLPKLDVIKQDLAGTQGAGVALDNQLKELTSEASTIDALHDRKKRGAYQILSGLAEVSDSPAGAAALIDLRDRLIPEGLASLKHSYLDEAGDAKLLSARLDDPSSALLKSIAVGGGHLGDVVDAWLAAATKLEAIEGQRSKLSSPTGKEAFVSKSAKQGAKNAAIRAVRMVESSLAMEGADQATVERLLTSVHRAEAKADRRAASGAVMSEEVDDTTESAEPEASPAPKANADT